MRIASVGHAVFAAILIALGILGVVTGDFTPVWQPVPAGMPAREVLVYLCAASSLACGLGLLGRRTAGVAARVLLAYVVLWWLLLRGRDLVLAPNVEGSWSGAGETAVIVAAAWVLYAWLVPAGVASGERGVKIARVIYGLALIPFGAAHFIYADVTASLVPSWLPWHLAWAYATGGAFLAAALAILTGVCARLAAALSALQIGLFTLLVWLPVVATAGAKSAFQWSETILSAALTAGAWLVAESYRGPRRSLPV